MKGLKRHQVKKGKMFANLKINLRRPSTLSLSETGHQVGTRVKGPEPRMLQKHQSLK